MKYKITPALKHIMLIITSYIHNCNVDILRFALYITLAKKKKFFLNSAKDVFTDLIKFGVADFINAFRFFYQV